MTPQYIPMNEEINLIDIVKLLLNQKGLILGITVLCTMLAVGVAIMLPREYRVEVVTMPAFAATAEKLTVHSMNISSDSSDSTDSSDQYFFKVEPEELYQGFIENLSSNRLRRQFFEDHELLQVLSLKEDGRSSDEIFKKEFSGKLTVKRINNSNNQPMLVHITLDGQDPELIADWLNGFVDLADKETIFEQTQAFLTKVQRVKEGVLHRIESLRIAEKARRIDLIVQLREALIVAEKIGWIDRPGNEDILYAQAKINKTQMSFSFQDMPLYLRGTKALQAEIEALEQRKNEDPFVPELRGLQEQLDYFSAASQDSVNAHAMMIDQKAIPDKVPIKPKRKLIVVVGCVLGALLAVLVVFIRNFAATIKQADS